MVRLRRNAHILKWTHKSFNARIRNIPTFRKLVAAITSAAAPALFNPSESGRHNLRIRRNQIIMQLIHTTDIYKIEKKIHYKHNLTTLLTSKMVFQPIIPTLKNTVQLRRNTQTDKTLNQNRSKSIRYKNKGLRTVN